MAFLILTTLALSPLAAWLGRRSARWAQLLALWPLFLTIWFARGFHSALTNEPLTDRLSWIPSMGLELSFRLDGLSGLFALLVTGIGTCIVVYGAHYFDGHPYSGRFQATLFGFMTAMLGVVLTDNVLALFVFWELTGFTSFLLIGFSHRKSESRRSAIQALIVTGSGGLALLAAAALLVQVTGSESLFTHTQSGELLRAHPFYLPIVLCLLLAAFTKSAQFPFHFWLPGAMAAPTPVSAYLHSATMVKAGVYLVARMSPAVGGTQLWNWTIAAVGAFTMLGAAYRAVQETDLKKILAYSTVSALGTIFFLLGLGTPATLTAAVGYIVAHACYKGTLFLVTGIIDHQTGTRDVARLAGLRRVLPVTAVAGGLAALSMMGLPPFFGFLAKEIAYEAVLAQPLIPQVALGALVLASALLGLCGLLVGYAPFVGELPQDLRETRRASPGLWLGPLLLGTLGTLGLFAGALSTPLEFAARSVVGRALPLELALWHGVTPPLLLSVATVALTLLLYWQRRGIRRFARPRGLNTARLYDGAVGVLDWISLRISRPLQDASLSTYVLVFVVTTGALIGTGLSLSIRVHLPSLVPLRTYEVLIVLLVVAAAITAVRARTTMTAVLSLGTAGYGVALTFLLYGAPDLAMTQFSVETLTAIIFVFVFWQFPKVEETTSRVARIRDGVVSMAFGWYIFVLTLVTAINPTSSGLSSFYAEAAPTLAHGRNIVNVILVDFRALDTLGEITVLVTAAVGVAALLHIASQEKLAR
ncbi:MAG: DUF4040 domain-containing protein [Myxococcales bacterium]|nr:DUF4040 domain-containing protein [Myxococcales bacterium]